MTYDDWSLYFTICDDINLFKKYSGSTGRFVIPGNDYKSRMDNFLKFYNSLSKRGRQEFDKLSIIRDK